jgi:hypothetical protein
MSKPGFKFNIAMRQWNILLRAHSNLITSFTLISYICISFLVLFGFNRYILADSIWNLIQTDSTTMPEGDLFNQHVCIYFPVNVNQICATETAGSWPPSISSSQLNIGVEYVKWNGISDVRLHYCSTLTIYLIPKQ